MKKIIVETFEPESEEAREYITEVEIGYIEDCVTFHLGEDLSIHIRVDDLKEILKEVKGN